MLRKELDTYSVPNSLPFLSGWGAGQVEGLDWENSTPEEEDGDAESLGRGWSTYVCRRHLVVEGGNAWLGFPFLGSSRQVSFPDAHQAAEQKLALARHLKHMCWGGLSPYSPGPCLSKRATEATFSNSSRLVPPGLRVLLSGEGSLPDNAGPLGYNCGFPHLVTHTGCWAALGC